MPIHASNDQLVREIERLKIEITRLNGENRRIANDYADLVSKNNADVNQYLTDNADLTRENDRLRKLVESQCIHNGHDVETIFYVGNPDPVSLTCRTCGRTWGVTAHERS